MIERILYNYKIKRMFLTIGEKINEVSPFLYEHCFLIIKLFVKRYILKRYVKITNIGADDFYHWPVEKNRGKKYEPKVSVIVPNYNHSRYLRKRLDSIYKQSYKNFEVILLDDCSTDDSQQVLKDYQKKYSDITKIAFNDKNGGLVFKQWEKGINLATGDLIWIAESDDWCESDFLENLIGDFQNPMVKLAFCRSEFIKNGIKIYSTDEYLRDLPSLDASEHFIISANDFVRLGMSVKNVIPNVSSVLFRRTDEMISDVVHNNWKTLKLCGDWLFYLDFIRGGLVSYNPKATNYYRIHDKSTSLNIQHTSEFYYEHEQIALYIAHHYKVSFEVFFELKNRLLNHWKFFNHERKDIHIDNLFNVDKIIEEQKKRLPNILMCGFSMVMGGGETYPIALANAYKRKNQTVTFVDFQLDKDDAYVKNMLDNSVPLLRLKDINYDGIFIKALGADIIHTQHGMVDEMVADYLNNEENKECYQIITLHGMYETIDKADLYRLLDKVKKTCKQFIYTADKNLSCFKLTQTIDYHQFVKIDNGLNEMPIHPVNRKLLGIKDDSFVFCLVSRGIPEKGWKEAIQAISMARDKSVKDIQLVIIGDGIMYNRLKSISPDFVRFLGVKSNIRDYFAMADMGILPSRFAGESYPLVIIDCLFSGKPVLASDIGEIRHQLTTSDGKLAGVLFPLDNWKISIQKLASIIIGIVNNPECYAKLLDNVLGARKKFDMNAISEQYLQVYANVIQKNNQTKN